LIYCRPLIKSCTFALAYMSTEYLDFQDFKLSKQLHYAIADLGFEKPTAIQQKAFAPILSGKNVLGIAQTGTGKTFAYMLPLLRELKFSKQVQPRILILVPTRELVLQQVEQIEAYAKYMSIRVVGVYGGTNINTQGQSVAQGCDILIGTPGRVYDLAMANVLKFKSITKLVIDEVDVMLDLGFIFQLTNIFELIPERRQNMMFSATMTDEIASLIDQFFIAPVNISVAISGTPLENIQQSCYRVENFYTKINLLSELIDHKNVYQKVLVFTATKKQADIVFTRLEERFGHEMGIVHSNKSQNYRIKSIEAFEAGTNRILITTDVMARGLDLDKISHVICMDAPNFPENYMHRIGRTGRAEEPGNAILFYTEKEVLAKEAIEDLMKKKIDILEVPEQVERSVELLPEERLRSGKHKNPNRNLKKREGGGAFHEKKDKNKKVNLGGKYRRELKKKYKKPQKRGDKIKNNRKKK